MGTNSKLDVDAQKWYNARETADFLTVTEGSVKKYCRSGTLPAKRVGPRKQWHVKGSSIVILRKKWELDTVQR